MKKIFILVILIVLLSTLAQAATLKGSIYNSNLELETNVLVEISSQKYLAKEGTFQFELPAGTYTLTAKKGFLSSSEEIEVSSAGETIYDLFLLEDFTEEDELWKDTEENLFDEEQTSYSWWRYLIAGLIILALLIRFLWWRKKYGPISLFRKKVQIEHKKTIAEHREDIAKEPGYLDRTLEIIKKAEGRITQKQLRKEMLDLSEAKISLILAELEHKGKIERIKSGRGKIILLK